jgi:hypothetical protein
LPSSKELSLWSFATERSNEDVVLGDGGSVAHNHYQQPEDGSGSGAHYIYTSSTSITLTLLNIDSPFHCLPFIASHHRIETVRPTIDDVQKDILPRIPAYLLNAAPEDIMKHCWGPREAAFHRGDVWPQLR